MEHYKIITDEKALRDFIEWLPDLTENEKFYYCLFARKKYCPELIKSNDRTQLKRGLATKENLFNKLSQLELPLGKWWLKDVVAPQESLVVYINPNPRDVIKGAWKTVNKLCKILENHSNGHNPVAECLSAIQQSKSYNFVIDFDFDENNIWSKKAMIPIIIDRMRGVLPSRYYKILETRGGIHLLVKPPLKKDYVVLTGSNKGSVIYSGDPATNMYDHNWYRGIRNIGHDLDGTLDQAGDNLMPIPGCVQGGFTPKFIT